MEKLNQNNRNTNRAEEDAYLRAKKRVDSVRGFYIHLATYVIINIFITSRRIYEHMEDGYSFENAFLDGEVYTLWIVWAVGLAIHGINVFSSSSVFGQNWEERKIKQYMNEDARNSK